MALTKEKNIQIAALNSKGYVIEAIAKKAGVSKEEVKESLDNRGRDYIELGAMSKGEKAEYIAGLSMDRLPIEEIVERTGLGKSSCYNYIKDGALRARKSRQAKADGEKKAEEASKPGRINEDFDKAVDEMIEESREEGKKVYEEAAVEPESEPIKTENEKRKEAGIEPIIEAEVKQASSEYLAAVKWAEDKGVDPTDKIAFVELLYKEFRDMYKDYNEAKNEKAHANMALSKMMEEVADLTRECKKLEAEKEKFINSPCECDNNRILKVCEMELKAAENVFMRIYGKLSDAERQAWDLGEIYANLMRARGEFV